MTGRYVHGYGDREQIRLQDQAATLVELLHADTAYAAGSRVLEAGCGIGAQTLTLATRSPGADFTCIDRSASSLAEAGRRAGAAGLKNVRLEHADIHALPYPPGAFDHVFVCFVIEHLSRPVETLRALKDVLRPGGSITVIEGDHGSAFFHPDGAAARRVIDCLVELQRRGGGNAHIGRELYPVLGQAGFSAVRVSPRMVYADANRPDLVDGFTLKTFTAMVEGIRESALAAELLTADAFDQGIRELRRTAEPDGVFCYTFFKAIGYA